MGNGNGYINTNELKNDYLSKAVSDFSEQVELIRESNKIFDKPHEEFFTETALQIAKDLDKALERSVRENAIWLIPYSDVDCGYGSFWDKAHGPESGRFYFKLLIGSKGELYMTAFTDFDEVEIGPGTEIMAMRAKWVLRDFCISPYTEEFIINPWSNNASIEKAWVENILDRCGIDWREE